MTGNARQTDRLDKRPGFGIHLSAVGKRYSTIAKLSSILWLSALLPGLLLLPGCATTRPSEAPSAAQQQQDITALEQAIVALGDDVDPQEARRAARVAIEYSRQLAREYEITGSPLMHNVMVNLGVKSRGLCKDWTRDLLVRLREEDFHSLKFDWAIANYEKAFRIEHSTVVVYAQGGAIEQGIVLDGWRNSGDLFWAPTLEDPDYLWHPSREIFALKKAAEEEAAGTAGIR